MLAESSIDSRPLGVVSEICHALFPNLEYEPAPNYHELTYRFLERARQAEESGHTLIGSYFCDASAVAYQLEQEGKAP